MPRKWSRSGSDVQRHPVIADPTAHPDPDRRDLVVAPAICRDPDPDAAGAPFASDAEPGQRGDHPFLQPPHMAAHVAAEPLQVEQHIGDALPRPVIGVLPAVATAVDRQPAEQVLGLGAGAGGVKRRMF